MYSGKSLNNKPLVSIKDGRKIGEIKDIYLDQDAREISALYVGKEGLLGRKAQVIERGKIAVFGVDVWLTNTTDAVTNLSEVDDAEMMLAMSDLRGREIYTSGGTKIATIGDVLLEDDCRVVGFALGRTYVKGTLDDKKRIARDAITDFGDEEIPITLDMSRAEMLQLPD